MRRILTLSRVTFIPASAFGLGTSALYHVGYVVPDIAAATAQFSDAIGARWVDHVVHARYLDENDQRVDTELHTAYSLEGPMHVELIEAAPGTIWDLGTGAAIHHVGLWTDDVSAEAQRLVDSGMPVIAGGLDNDDPGVPGFFSYHRNPQGGNVELVHVDKQRAMHDWLRE
jgi:hypothetical protein